MAEQQSKAGRDQPSLPDPPSFKKPYRVLLVLFALALWLPGFFSLPPGDRDESRFALATRQMTETGDYLRIMNGTEPRNRKPIGIYWLQAPFALAVGPGRIWAYRIPSLLGGIAAILAVFETGLLFWADRRTAALAAAMLAASVILTVETHIAKTDAALLGATTIAMALLARAWMGAGLRRWQAALFWLAAGAGILIKGPITPMVLGLAASALCLWDRRGRWLRALRPGWGAPLMLAVVLPWFVAIGIVTHGRFFADAVGSDLGHKLAGGAEAHGGFPGLHLLLLPLLAFPATLPVLGSLQSVWSGRRDRATMFLIAWVAPSWLVFEAVPTKLPHYTLPLYPALFLFAARIASAPAAAPAADRRGWISFTRGVLVLCGVILAVASLALPVALRAPWWLGLPAALSAALVTALAWRRALVWSLAAAIPLYAAILQFELPRLPALWIAPRVEAALRQSWPQWTPHGDGLAVAGYAEPSLMFETGTATQILPDGAAAAEALFRGSASLALVSDRDLAKFDARAEKLGLHTIDNGEIAGFNYSRGRWVTLSMMTKTR